MVTKTKEMVSVKSAANALTSLASSLRVNPESLKETLKKTAFRECKTDEEFIAAVVVAEKYKLNPFTNEIYAFPGRKGGVVPIVGFDGWVSIVNRQSNYDGVELLDNLDEKGQVVSVTAHFHLKDRSHPVVVTEYMEECQRDTAPWKQYPRRMLRHKAYIQGARVAFGLSGIYDEDEAERIIECEKQDKGSVEMPRAVVGEQQQELIGDKAPLTPYGEMFEQFALAKENAGSDVYYYALKKHGFKHANEIKTIEEGNKILKEIQDALNA
jgi:phage recombination protein Bet